MIPPCFVVTDGGSMDIARGPPCDDGFLAECGLAAPRLGLLANEHFYGMRVK